MPPSHLWFGLTLLLVIGSANVRQAIAGDTQISLENGRWHINGSVTYPGTRAEGLLMNVRMVNSTFEDLNPETCPKDFEPNANTEAFLSQIPHYKAQGVRAFTLCLQGGSPDYEKAINSAFQPDGSLRPDYLDRLARVIDACDQQGIAVILGCYYQRQDQILRDEQAVRNGVVHVAEWIRDRDWKHVMLEIANEYDHRGFDHDVIETHAGQAELIRLAKQTSPELLVSASGLGHGRMSDEVAQAADFLLPHFNGTPLEEIASRMLALRKHGKAIVVNEDDKVGEEGAAAAQLSVNAGVSWGFMSKEVNQYYPFQFRGTSDDPPVYRRLKLLTSPIYYPPTDANGGWRTLSDPEAIEDETGIKVSRLDAALAVARANTSNGGLLVLRHGTLVYEEYFGLGHREATPNLASIGKSFTSMAVGILLQERAELFPQGLRQKVYTPEFLPPEAFPLDDQRKAEIELGQLLTFTAGIRGNNPSFVHGASTTLDPAGPDGSSAMIDAIALGKQESKSGEKTTSTMTLWCEPGNGYSYATSSIHLASIMLRHVTGRELRTYIDDHLARPLGWGTWGYGYQTNRRLTHTPGGGGICMRATDMLRFGYLMLNRGRWGDRQIIPAEYIDHASRQSPFNPHYPYSLQFNVNTRGEIAELPRDAYWKSGSGGHVIYIVPSLDLVVWKLGGRDGQYSPEDTGLPVHPDAAREAKPREDWQQTISDEAATVQTLKLVVEAIVN